MVSIGGASMAFGGGGRSDDQDEYRVTLEALAEIRVDAEDRRSAIRKAKNKVRERDYKVQRSNAKQTR